MTQANESLLIELLTEMRDEIRTMREFMEKRETSYQTKEEVLPKPRTKSHFSFLESKEYQDEKKLEQERITAGMMASVNHK